ncbi:MAG: peptidase T4, partial [Mesorhizobium sp.]
VLDSGVTIGALAAVNPTGSVTVGRSRHFWAAPLEIGDEFGGLGYPDPMPEEAGKILLKYRDRRIGAQDGNTTIAIVATDAVLTKAGATMARAISRGVHAATPAGGDLFPVWSSR